MKSEDDRQTSILLGLHCEEARTLSNQAYDCICATSSLQGDRKELERSGGTDGGAYDSDGSGCGASNSAVDACDGTGDSDSGCVVIVVGYAGCDGHGNCIRSAYRIALGCWLDAV